TSSRSLKSRSVADVVDVPHLGRPRAGRPFTSPPATRGLRRAAAVRTPFAVRVSRPGGADDGAVLPSGRVPMRAGGVGDGARLGRQERPARYSRTGGLPPGSTGQP